MTLLRKSNGPGMPDLPTVFDDFLNRDWLDLMGGINNGRSQLPAVNIQEKDDRFELEVAAPGMKKEDFDVELNNDMLTISAERQTSHEENEKGSYTRREFSYQSFSRSFQLPERTVKGEEIDAQYRDGVLHITIPKSEEAKTKPAKRIKVK